MVWIQGAIIWLAQNQPYTAYTYKRLSIHKHKQYFHDDSLHDCRYSNYYTVVSVVLEIDSMQPLVFYAVDL